MAQTKISKERERFQLLLQDGVSSNTSQIVFKLIEHPGWFEDVVNAVRDQNDGKEILTEIRGLLDDAVAP